MHALLRTFRALLATCALLVAATATAGDVSRADARQVRAVIESQLAAFAADDARRAFSFAAPGIRKMFGSPERFLTMVREGYPVVYRPTSVTFPQPERNGADIVQAVQMKDSEGVLWLAVYELQRQADRSWRISSCIAMPYEGRTT
jgi:hypothetical protein